MILLSSNTAWSIYNFRNGLIRYFINKKIEVVVLAPHDHTSEKLKEMGCKVIDIPISQKGTNPISDIKLLVNIYKHFVRLRPKFIILYTIKPNIYGSIAARLAGIPCIAVTTGLGYTFLTQNLISKIAKKLYKFALRFPKEIWFLNEDDLSIFLEHGLVKTNKAKLLNGEGVDIDHFAPMSTIHSGDKTRFLLIGRMMWDKGIGEFVEAAKIVRDRYPNVTFSLLGACGVQNPSAITNKQLVKWQNENIIEYLGTTDDVRPYIAEADCVVLPSYREGIPRSLIEASSMGKPIIASDAPGCRDVVLQDITGLICKHKNAASLAECCMRIIEMPQFEREQMGSLGRKFIESRYDERKIIKQYIDTLIRYDAFL